ncbi:hypothetical protein N8J89_07785 [Crossiella sp. CA-258035]|uniref:hypothetical protein n=1 Tax=Crossiella sp. CA-258035 TaxID=2981138 RepID=UPI0024BCCA6F|nr:hypothetical protein [Crossiella sp. CA-258035]WHT20954.1 hypothetical protein N8J89_07785 [Crossiella sp. CA-258035]
MNDTIEISPEVQRGVDWLDNQTPGWDKDIDLLTPDMGDAGSWVLGQVYGDFYECLVGKPLTWAETHGFNGSWLDSTGSCPLIAQWRQMIVSRRGQS